MDSLSPKVSPRMATVLIPGESRSGEKFSEPRQSQLYKITTMADDQVLILGATVSMALLGTTLAGAMAPSSGRFSEGHFLYASSNMTTQTLLAALPKKGEQYIALLPSNLAGGAGFDYTLNPKVSAARRFASKEDPKAPDSPAMPLATVMLEGAALSNDGALDMPGDVDYLRVNVNTTGRLYVQATTPNLHFSNPAISVGILQGDCMTTVAPPRTAQQEAPVSAGQTYCLRIAAMGTTVELYQIIIANL
jgi:hypothetical protein